MESVNPFVPNAPFLYPLKTSENLTVFLCFQGVQKECIGNEWIKISRVSFECLYKSAIKSCGLIRKVCKENISTENCVNNSNYLYSYYNYSNRVIDHVLDNEIEAFIIHLSENEDVNNSCVEM